MSETGRPLPNDLPRCDGVASIVVTFRPDLALLGEALRAHAATGIGRLVVVDNGSPEAATVERLVREAGRAGPAAADFLPLHDNLGVAAAQNAGIAHAAAAGASHVALFDQDSRVPSDLIGRLLAAEAALTARGVRVGAVGPAFTDPRTGNAYPQARVAGLRLKKLWPQQQGEAPFEVSFIIASGSLIRTAVLREVGGMDESFFIDAVDIEWCFRATARGWRIFVTPDARIVHTIGDRRVRSLGREISIHSPLRRYYMARNDLLLARRRWVPAGFRLRQALGVVLRAPAFLVAVGFDRRYVRHMALGVLHGLLGRGGPYRP